MSRSSVHPNPALFLDSLRETFDAACSSSGSLDHFIRVGTETIRLRFAGSALLRHILPAFQHVLVDEVQSPGLTIDIFDSISTNRWAVCFPWSREDIQIHGLVDGFNDGAYRTMVSFYSGALSVIDLSKGSAFWWIRDATSVPMGERGSPLLVLLHWWMAHRGLQFLHAGAIGRVEGGVLLIGKGGSGKSTSSLSCLNSTLGYAADDYCVVRPDPNPTVYSIYGTGKLDRGSLDRLPFLKSRINESEPDEDEKSLLYVSVHFPDRVILEFPLRAILIPQIVESETVSLQPVKASEALRTLGPNTLFQLPGSNATTFNRLAVIARSVPSYRLQIGRDTEALPGLIDNLLNNV